MNRILSDEIEGWKAADSVETYNRETIFDYMNGAGEVYRLYDYRKLAVKRYTHDKHPAITIELFDMGTPEDAYGIFSHSRTGDDAGVGIRSEYRGGLLCFLKGSYFACVYAEKQTDETKQAVFELARVIEKKITGESRLPEVLKYLPEENLQKQSVRYFHKHTSLNCHYYLAEQNILNLDDKTEAVFARYSPDDIYLLYIRYDSQTRAQQAIDSFIAGYIPEAKDSGLAQIEQNKWVKASLFENYVLVILDAPNAEQAVALANSVIEKINKPL